MAELINIGVGEFNWPRMERVSDRYGRAYVSGPMAINEAHRDQRVTLRAVVLETRQSTHMGDLFHGIFPETPEVGEVITLGTGLLFLDNEDDVSAVGVRPFDDDRETMWMDIKALYRCHQQTVRLVYEPLETSR